MRHDTSPTPIRARDPRRRERGAAGVKLIISLVFLALLAHIAYVFLPLYIAVYDFNSQVEKEANYAATKTNETIVKDLTDYAAERHLPVKKENLNIVRGQSRISIKALYTVAVATVFYTYKWEVDITKEAVLF